MKRLWPQRLLIALIAVMGFSACLTLEVRTRLGSDGSAERAVVIAVDSVLLQTAAVDPMEPLRAKAEASGWRVERYQDSERGQEGLRLYRPLAALEDLNHLAEGDPLAGLERIALGEEGDLQTLNVTLSVSGILDRLRIAAGEPPLSEGDLSLLRAANLRLVYDLELPGPIVDYSPRSGAEAEGHRIRWAIPLSPDQPAVSLYVAWRPVRSVPICAGGWIGPLVVFGMIGWLQRAAHRGGPAPPQNPAGNQPPASF